MSGRLALKILSPSPRLYMIKNGNSLLQTLHKSQNSQLQKYFSNSKKWQQLQPGKIPRN